LALAIRCRSPRIPQLCSDPQREIHITAEKFVRMTEDFLKEDLRRDLSADLAKQKQPKT
jgi:hypothetical protein